MNVGNLRHRGARRLRACGHFAVRCALIAVVSCPAFGNECTAPAQGGSGGTPGSPAEPSDQVPHYQHHPHNPRGIEKKPYGAQNFLWTGNLGYLLGVGSKLDRYLRQYSYIPTAADVDGGGQPLMEGPTSAEACDGVIIGSGNLVYAETDFVGSGEMPLKLVRQYNKSGLGGIFGSRWSSTFDYQAGLKRWSWKCEIRDPEDSTPPAECLDESLPPKLVVVRPGGVETQMTGSAGVYTQGDAVAIEKYDSGGAITGWEITTADKGKEIYNAAGRPVKILNKHGIGWTYSYVGSSAAINRVTHTSGRYVKFNWVDREIAPGVVRKQLVSLVDPAGKTHSYSYAYHSYTGEWRLAGVTLPNQESRTYHYELPPVLRTHG